MNTTDLNSSTLRETLAELSTANLSDAMQSAGTLPEIHAVQHDMKLLGQALTVRTSAGDWASVTKAIDIAQEGDVLVVDAGGLGPAVWGELATHSAIQRKLAGIVIHGAARDVHEIQKLNFPLFCRLIVPNAGRPRETGEIGKVISISGVSIAPGDWIVGDSSGVVAIAQEKTPAVVHQAKQILDKEYAIREKIKQGSTLWQQIGLHWL